jgi:hypothetical protein
MLCTNVGFLSLCITLSMVFPVWSEPGAEKYEQASRLMLQPAASTSRKKAVTITLP